MKTGSWSNLGHYQVSRIENYLQSSNAKINDR